MILFLFVNDFHFPFRVTSVLSARKPFGANRTNSHLQNICFCILRFSGRKLNFIESGLFQVKIQIITSGFGAIVWDLA